MTLVDSIQSEREKQMQAAERGIKPKPDSEILALWKSMLTKWFVPPLTSDF